MLTELLEEFQKKHRPGRGLILFQDPVTKALCHINEGVYTWSDTLSDGYQEAVNALSQKKIAEPVVISVPINFYSKNKIFVDLQIRSKAEFDHKSMIAHESKRINLGQGIGLGMFMPFSRVLKTMQNKMPPDPDGYKEALSAIINTLEDSCAPCNSCGDPCLVPKAGNSDISDKEANVMLKIAERGNCFCIKCGVKSLSAMTLYAGIMRGEDYSSIIASLNTIDPLADDFNPNVVMPLIQSAVLNLKKTNTIISSTPKGGIKTMTGDNVFDTKDKPWLN